MTLLIPVLGDQLSSGLASLRDVDRSMAVVLLAEVAGETGYVRHHKKKIALVLSAMRHFAAELRAGGWTVDYVTLDAPGNTGSLTGEVGRAVVRHGATAIRTVEAGEWRVLAMQESWAAAFGVPCDIVPDDRFLCAKADFLYWARARKTLVMEDFYREMRKRTGLLMRVGKPVGNRWNYDADNRKTPPRGLNTPGVATFEPDATTREVLTLVGERFVENFGDLEPFRFATTRAEALRALDHFVTHALPRFGDYQDAMVAGQDHLWHAALSPYLNCGLLTPREVLDAAVAAYEHGDAPLNAVEGFVRQILGWREYVRGMYGLEGRTTPRRTRSARRATCPLSTGPATPTCAAWRRRSARHGARPMRTISCA